MLSAAALPSGPAGTLFPFAAAPQAACGVGGGTAIVASVNVVRMVG